MQFQSKRCFFMDINKILEKLDSLFSQNNTDDAEIFLTKSLDSAISEGDTGAIISVLNELIGLYRDTSQFEKAVPYCGSLEKLIRSFQLDDNINGATSYLNIANLYYTPVLFLPKAVQQERQKGNACRGISSSSSLSTTMQR